MQTDPVRSIRMAAALNERYGALLRTSTLNSVDRLELKIGEADQIYPEIWRHLDEARAALVAQGIAVAQYDSIRATEDGYTAVTGVEIHEDRKIVLATGGYAGPTKTASFNVSGHRKALAACNVLQATLPNIDWAGLEREEQAEIAAAGSLTAGNWKSLGLTVVVLAVVVALGVMIYKLVM